MNGKGNKTRLNYEIQGVKACESIYVDDCKEEADGAREQGFTSFYLDRSGENKDNRTIHNLKQLIDFVEVILCRHSINQ